MIKKNIFFVGFMGAGKSRLGKRVAYKLGMPFIDTDSYIEKLKGKSVEDIIINDGIEAFRIAEKECLDEIIKSKSLVVVATGGGLVCYNNNMHSVNNNGYSIYLQLSPAELLVRLLRAKVERPLLKGMSKREMYEFIQKTLFEREEYYLKSHVVLNGISLKPEQVINILKSNCYEASTD